MESLFCVEYLHFLYLTNKLNFCPDYIHINTAIYFYHIKLAQAFCTCSIQIAHFTKRKNFYKRIFTNKRNLPNCNLLRATSTKILTYPPPSLFLLQ